MSSINGNFGKQPGRRRAPPNGNCLNEADAAIVKSMIARGDIYAEIANWFGVNPGRIAEVATGQSFRDVVAAEYHELPPPGPYATPRELAAVAKALSQAQLAIADAERLIRC